MRLPPGLRTDHRTRCRPHQKLAPAPDGILNFITDSDTKREYRGSRSTLTNSPAEVADIVFVVGILRKQVALQLLKLIRCERRVLKDRAPRGAQGKFVEPKQLTFGP